jgi:Zn-dependent alcohol dehydrogenase
VAWAGSAEATAERVLEASGGGVDYAIEATGRPEAALAAFLSTRARGAAVLIGIFAADAALTLPALPIPRMERRILGSVYGSSRPERDIPALLELFRRGRLPLDRLVSRRLPLDAVEEAFTAMRGGDALRVVLDLEGVA